MPFWDSKWFLGFQEAGIPTKLFDPCFMTSNVLKSNSPNLTVVLIWSSLIANNLAGKVGDQPHSWSANTNNQYIHLVFYDISFAQRGVLLNIFIWYESQLNSRLGNNCLCLFWKKLNYTEVNNLLKSIKRLVALPKTDLESPNLTTGSSLIWARLLNMER